MADEISVDELRKSLIHSAKKIQENREYLCELDSAIGDGDHGNSMSKGFKAVENKLENNDPDTVGHLFKLVGTTLMKNMGGATGPIFATLFMSAGKKAGDRKNADLDTLADMFETSLKDVSERGDAKPGDKTMIDALKPAVEALRESGKKDRSITEGMKLAYERASEGVEKTKEMKPSRGKAKSLGDRAIGHQDPGATSVSLIFKAMHGSIKKKNLANG